MANAAPIVLHRQVLKVLFDGSHGNEAGRQFARLYSLAKLATRHLAQQDVLFIHGWLRSPILNRHGDQEPSRSRPRPRPRNQEDKSRTRTRTTRRTKGQFMESVRERLEPGFRSAAASRRRRLVQCRSVAAHLR